MKGKKGRSDRGGARRPRGIWKEAGPCGWEGTLASTKKEASDTLFLSIFTCLFASVSLETIFCKEATLES